MARPRPGWKPTKPFQPGNSLGGRSRGARGKYPKSIWQELEQRGDRSAVDLLSEVANSQLVDMNLRIQAMGMLASYQSGKRPAYRYIEDVVGMKAPRTIEEAAQYISRISVLVAEGKLDVDGGAAVKELLQAYIDARVGSEIQEQVRILEEIVRAQGDRLNATVQVVGGLPTMPGLEKLVMPHRPEPPTIEHQSGKPNPWVAPDVGSAVDVSPKKRGRPRKHSKLGADDDGDPEPS
jgi:hypothetical protein